MTHKQFALKIDNALKELEEASKYLLTKKGKPKKNKKIIYQEKVESLLDSCWELSKHLTGAYKNIYQNQMKGFYSWESRLNYWSIDEFNSLFSIKLKNK